MDEELGEDEMFTVGKSDDQDIQIDLEGVSRKHALFAPSGMKDISSKGTFIHLRNPLQDYKRIQSAFVEIVNNAAAIQVGQYSFKIIQ